MNLPTIIIIAILLVWAYFAIRKIRKGSACGCGDDECSCGCGGKKADAKTDSSSEGEECTCGCGGKK